MKTLPIPHHQIRFAGLCGVGPEMALRGPLIDLGSAQATAMAIWDVVSSYGRICLALNEIRYQSL